MVQNNTGGIAGSNKGFFPVVIPVAFLLILTGAVRTYTFLTTEQNRQQSTQKQPVFSKGFNPTEETFSQYAAVLKLLNSMESRQLSQSEQEDALATLKTLAHEPISMEGNTFQDVKMGRFSPETLLLSLSQCLAKGAQRSAKAGDPELARQYVDALYGIGDHVLSNSTPTLKGLESAHHFLGFAARVQVSIFAKGDYSGVAARYREWALMTLWKKQISPRIESSSAISDTKNEPLLAASIAQEYRDGWSRIRAGEA